MKDLFVKLIELRTRLITYSKLSDSTRELGISSSISNFLEDVKENYSGFDMESANYNAAIIINCAKPQELRETLLESFINSLNKINEDASKDFLLSSLKDMFILEKLFSMRLFEPEFIDNIERLLQQFTELKSQMPEKYTVMREVVTELHQALKAKIDEMGVTLRQMELVGREMLNWDYLIIDNRFQFNDSEYRSVVALHQVFIVFCSIKYALK